MRLKIEITLTMVLCFFYVLSAQQLSQISVAGSYAVEDEIDNLLSKFNTALLLKDIALLKPLIYNSTQNISFVNTKGSKKSSTIEGEEYNSGYKSLFIKELKEVSENIFQIKTDFSFSKQKIDKLFVIKNGKRYFIIETPLLQDIIKSFSSTSQKSTESLNRISNSSLIPFHHFVIQGEIIFEMSPEVTQNYLNRYLFGYNSQVDIIKIHYGNNKVLVSTFLTDGSWDRLIYGNTQQDEIKSYEELDNSGGLECLSGITSEMNGEGENIFYTVAERNKTLCKFKYTGASNNVQLLNKFLYPNLDKPEPKRKKSVNLGYENINGNLQRKNKLNAFLL